MRHDNKWAARMFGRAVLFFLPVGLLLILFHCVIGIGKIPSHSMEPALKAGDYILYNRLAYKIRDVERYDVVVFKDDVISVRPRCLVKRVIALPGETVEIKNGMVYIDGEVLEEIYLPAGTWTEAGEQGTYSIPEDCCFVLGDNRDDSMDSRHFESPYVRMEQVIGKVLY